MSLLPLQTINTLRSIVSTMISIYGIDCELYIPKASTVQQQEKLDIYQEKPELQPENAIKTKVWIEWKPDTKRLRKLGIFTEDTLPILAWFEGIPELTRGAWIRIPINIAEGQNTTDELELTDHVIKNMYNAIIIQAFVIAPRRK